MNRHSGEVREFVKIAQDLRPKGFKVSVQDVTPYLGKIFYQEKEIQIKEFPSTLGTLWTLLHEYDTKNCIMIRQSFRGLLITLRDTNVNNGS
jgi:hypothetical protein